MSCRNGSRAEAARTASNLGRAQLWVGKAIQHSGEHGDALTGSGAHAEGLHHAELAGTAPDIIWQVWQPDGCLRAITEHQKRLGPRQHAERRHSKSAGTAAEHTKFNGVVQQGLKSGC